MTTSHLPNPSWTELAQVCLSCGYALEGLAAPGTCPECGTVFAARQLVLCGIVRRSAGTPAWRRAAWAAVLTLGGGGVYTLPYLIVRAWPVAACVVACVGGGLVYLLVTSPRERAGTERIVVMTAGIARLPLDEPKAGARIDSEFAPWPPDAVIELKRVGAFWRRLLVRSNAGAGRVMLDAGVRCSDEEADAVLAWLRLCASAPRHPRGTGLGADGAPSSDRRADDRDHAPGDPVLPPV